MERMLRQNRDLVILQVPSSCLRKGKHIAGADSWYQRYTRFRRAIYPLRALHTRCRRLDAKAARKQGIIPVIKKVLRYE